MPADVRTYCADGSPFPSQTAPSDVQMRQAAQGTAAAAAIDKVGKPAHLGSIMFSVACKRERFTIRPPRMWLETLSTQGRRLGSLKITRRQTSYTTSFYPPPPPRSDREPACWNMMTEPSKSSSYDGLLTDAA